MRLPVLIIEDTPSVADALSVLLEIEGIPYEVARTPSEAQQRVSRGDVGVAIQDMNFAPHATSGAQGIELFRRLRKADPELPVLLMTAWTSLETAVQLVKEGAADYFAKPWDDAKLLGTLRTLLTMRELQLENTRLRAERHQSRSELSRSSDLCGLVYESDAMHRLALLAVQAAKTDVPVLITGPHGCGKEKFAEIVVANSRRRDRPFLKVNLGGIPIDLLESELFGAEPGAFTGVTRTRIGRFEAAHQGTIFLDEIGNLPLAGQVKLLRVLQTGSFERLGSTQTRTADARLIAATNADIAAEIATGRFREDLFFRLNVLELRIPPLNQRRDDILPIARSVLPTSHTLSLAAERALFEHDWPGNVRELLNRLQRAMVVADSAELTPHDLDLVGDDEAAHRTGSASVEDDSVDERTQMRLLLARHSGNVSRAAEELGLSRQAFYRRMEKLGVGIERRLRE
jgi:DNA-binding NtrC family response regulator